MHVDVVFWSVGYVHVSVALEPLLVTCGQPSAVGEVKVRTMTATLLSVEFLASARLGRPQGTRVERSWVVHPGFLGSLAGLREPSEGSVGLCGTVGSQGCDGGTCTCSGEALLGESTV